VELQYFLSTGIYRRQLRQRGGNSRSRYFRDARLQSAVYTNPTYTALSLGACLIEEKLWPKHRPVKSKNKLDRSARTAGSYAGGMVVLLEHAETGYRDN